MAEWSQALDWHADLVRWWQTDAAERYASAFYTDSNLEEERGEAFHPLNQRDRPHDSVAREMVLLLNEAPTYWITAEMVDLVDAAWKSMPRQPLRTTDLPTMSGFAVFARRLWIWSDDDDRTAMRAIAWYVTDAGLAIEAYMAKADLVASSEHYGLDLDAGTRGNMPPLVVMHANGWKLGDDYADQHLRKWLYCAWILMGQRLAQTGEARPDRATRRRLEDTFARDRQVRVVTLRRPTQRTDPDEEHTVDWSHRWMVDGHWRNQWCPSTKEHRLTFIAPYVKGPEGLPFKEKDRVMVWKR